MEREELAAESMRVLAFLEQRDQEEEENRQSIARLLAPTIPPPPLVPQFTEMLELDLDEPFAIPLTRRTNPPPTPGMRMKDMRLKLAEAWVLLTEVREQVTLWKDRSAIPTRLRPLEARLQHAVSMVDDAIYDLEPKQQNDRITLKP